MATTARAHARLPQHLHHHQRYRPTQVQGQGRGPILPCYGVWEVNRDYDYYDHSYDDCQYPTPSPNSTLKPTSSMAFTSSPERIRRSASGRSVSSGGTSAGLSMVPEERILVDFPTTHTASRDHFVMELQMDEQADDNDDDDELEEWELDEALSQHGLYRGSYRRILLIYTLTPLAALLAFTLLALLPCFAYPLSGDEDPPQRRWWSSPALPYFPHPLPDLVISAALFSLSYVLRRPISLFFEKCCPDPTFSSRRLDNNKSHSKLLQAKPYLPLPLVLSTLTQTTITLTLLLFPLIAQPPVLVEPSSPPSLLSGQHKQTASLTTRDAVFHRVWWMALGWGAAESIAAIWKGYQARSWYKDVIVQVKKDTSSAGIVVGGETTPERQPLLSPRSRRMQGHYDDSVEEQVEEELEELLAIRAREELEEAFGVPVIKIPVFLSCLRQVNALLLTQGLALLLGYAFLQSTLSIPAPHPTPPSTSPPVAAYPTRSNLPLATTIPACIVAHFYLSIIYTPFVLPRMGVPVVVYHASLVSLGVFFAGLAVWEGLV